VGKRHRPIQNVKKKLDAYLRGGEGIVKGGGLNQTDWERWGLSPVERGAREKILKVGTYDAVEFGLPSF